MLGAHWAVCTVLELCRANPGVRVTAHPGEARALGPGVPGPEALIELTDITQADVMSVALLKGNPSRSTPRCGRWRSRDAGLRRVVFQ